MENEEKEVLCKELPPNVNQLVLAFPTVFGALLEYQNLSPSFFEYFKSVIDRLSDIGVVVIQDDEKDPKHKSLSVKVCEIINQSDKVDEIVKEIDGHIKKEMEEARRKFELQTGLKREKTTESGIVLPGSMPESTPKILM